MTKKQEKERPPAKDRVASVRVPPDVYEAAEAKAKERGSTVAKIIRSFLTLFAADETPPGWPPDMPDEEVRAAKRNQRKKK